jgi:hypothetical protein
MAESGFNPVFNSRCFAPNRFEGDSGVATKPPDFEFQI